MEHFFHLRVSNISVLITQYPKNLSLAKRGIMSKSQKEPLLEKRPH